VPVCQPKGEPISQKDGRRDTLPPLSSVQHPTFCGQFFIDTQGCLLYTFISKNKIPIKNL
jgi:hypothetical protein